MPKGPHHCQASWAIIPPVPLDGYDTGHWVFNFLAGNYINELVPNKNYKYIKKGIYAEKTALCISFNNLHAKKKIKKQNLIECIKVLHSVGLQLIDYSRKKKIGQIRIYMWGS